MLNFINLLTPSVTMPGGTDEVATQAANAVSEVATEATSATASIFGMQMGKGGSTAILILYIAALALVFYFFAVRPQKKRAAQLKEIQQGIKVGDEVMTSSGFYGKVVELQGDDVAVVEFGTNRGVRIPVNKSEIIGNKNAAAKTEK